MKLNLQPGKYVAAVSAGIDSMVMLYLLSKCKNVEIVVAHFDHGIRDDSGQDTELVENAAKKLHLPFELGKAKLGPKASEARARQKRYEFLEKIRNKYQAKAIITAHHQDDLLETAIINTLRGTGWRGLVAITRNPKIVRPLLPYSKAEIKTYAKTYRILWREDPTNLDQRYLRNRVRRQIMPKLSQKERAQLLVMIENIKQSAPVIEESLTALSKDIKEGSRIVRRDFSILPAAISNELVRQWLEAANIKDVDRPMTERVSLALKSAKANTKHNVAGGLWLKIGQTTARLIRD